MCPKVSVIMPSLNEEKYIEDAILSIRGQTCGNAEIIVVDGCSSDRTPEIAKKHADKVIVMKTNIPQARNLGARHAKGDILVFVDADTSLSSRWVESILEDFKEPGTACVFGPVMPKEASMKNRILCKMFYNLFQRAFLSFNFPQFSAINLSIRKEVFEGVDGFDERLSAAEDIDIARKIRHMGKTVFNKKAVAYTSMRRHKSLYEGTKLLSNWAYYSITGRSRIKNYQVLR
jgi:glycosyltransferase involved in cell wall biosynthesis